jgi:8-oxo-dGTP pyrophosphatase MutT (NUDIX family)
MILHSGVIPYRIQAGEVEILLVKSSGGKHWVIPKGWITPWLTSAQSAAKEAWEEAGVVGTIRTPAIGYYRIQKWGLWLNVEVFLLHVTQELSNYPESKVRARQWMSVPDAAQQIRQDDLKQLLLRFEKSGFS